MINRSTSNLKIIDHPESSNRRPKVLMNLTVVPHRDHSMMNPARIRGLDCLQKSQRKHTDVTRTNENNQTRITRRLIDDDPHSRTLITCEPLCVAEEVVNYRDEKVPTVAKVIHQRHDTCAFFRETTKKRSFLTTTVRAFVGVAGGDLNFQKLQDTRPELFFFPTGRSNQSLSLISFFLLFSLSVGDFLVYLAALFWVVLGAFF